jgi:hypothetical protein
LLADPEGVDNTLGTEDDDVRLTSGSSAIDTASDAAVPDDDFDLNHDGDTSEPLPWDLGRGDRFLGTGPTVDMGAYEYLNTNGLGDPELPVAGEPAPEPSGTACIAFTYVGRHPPRVPAALSHLRGALRATLAIGATGGIVRPRKDAIFAVENAEMADGMQEVVSSTLIGSSSVRP